MRGRAESAIFQINVPDVKAPPITTGKHFYISPQFFLTLKTFYMKYYLIHHNMLCNYIKYFLFLFDRKNHKVMPH